MKILEINVDNGAGGSTGRIANELAHGLAEAGNDVCVAYGRCVKSGDSIRSIKIGTKLDLYVHGLITRFFDAHGLGSTLATMQLVRKMKAFNPDVIHLHNIHGYYINYKVLFKYIKQAKIRVVWTLHDCWALTGHSACCDASSCDKWNTGCGKCPRKTDYPKSFVDRSKTNWIQKKAAFSDVEDLTIVTPSKWLAGLVKESFLGNYPVIVINNGIDTDLFKPVVSNFKKKYSIDNKIMLLAVASTWSSLKGLQDYVELSKRLDSRFVLVMIGLNKSQIKDLPDTIMCLERTEGLNELIEAYSAADAFVNLSYCESFSMVNLESICCGTGVITYNSGGCPESAEENGILIEKGNIGEVLNTINTVDYHSLKKSIPTRELELKYGKAASLNKYIEILTHGRTERA